MRASSRACLRIAPSAPAVYFAFLLFASCVFTFWHWRFSLYFWALPVTSRRFSTPYSAFYSSLPIIWSFLFFIETSHLLFILTYYKNFSNKFQKVGCQKALPKHIYWEHLQIEPLIHQTHLFHNVRFISPYVFLINLIATWVYLASHSENLCGKVKALQLG